MHKKWNGLAALLMSCAILPAAHAKEAHALQNTNAAEQSVSAIADKTDKKKVSYGIGVDIGRNFKRLELNLDIDALSKGLKDASAG